MSGKRADRPGSFPGHANLYVAVIFLGRKIPRQIHSIWVWRLAHTAEEEE